MSTTLPRVDEASDAELISAVRGGDVDAYGELFGRHVGAARRLARQLVSPSDADDLVSEAFAKVLGVLQRGGGPDLAFRAYLLTAVRRLHVDRIRTTARLHHTDDLTAFDPGVPFRDTAVEGFESAAAARAFASLPERWQLVLWHTEVEGQKPAEVAPLLGLSPNSVSALAYRAREGLRQAFLSMHAQDALEASCAWTQEHLGAYVRGGLARRDATKVEAHLEECRRCAAVYLELTEINSDLGALLAPLLLGGAAAAYLAASGGAAAGGLLPLLGRLRDLVAGHAPATAAAGVALTAVVAGLLYDVPGPPGTDPRAGSTTRSDPGGDASHDHGTGAHHHPRRGTPPAGSGATAPRATSSPATGAAPPAPAGTRSPGPADQPSDQHSGQPSDQPSDQPSGPGPGQPDGPPGVDLAVTASATPSTSGAAFRVVVTVTGLPDGGRATLGVTSDHTAVALAPDPRCAGLAVGHGSCSVTGTPATYTFVVATTPEAPTTLTFTVRARPPAVEADPSDNSTRVLLNP